MSRVHDLGGMHGFGAVPTDDEGVFHAAWEARIFGIRRVLGHQGVFAIDEFRHSVERLPPARYLSVGYYERWVDAVEQLLVERGVLQPGEVDQRAADAGEGHALPGG